MIVSLPTTPQLTNLWVPAVNPSKLLAMMTKLVTVAEEIIAGKDATDSIDSTKKLMITSLSLTYPLLSSPTSSQDELTSMHLSPLPLPSLVVDASRLATLKKTATPLSVVPIVAKYATGKNDRNSTASCLLPHSGFHQTDKRNDRVTRQEVATGAEDHQDPENPYHSISLVLCTVMSSYDQVWDP